MVGRTQRATLIVRAASAITLGLAVGAAASAETLDVSIACRDGVPNGGYELRGADGRLRVAGAFSKGHRTGTFIFWNARGARVAVIPYDDDVKVGTVALWHAPRGASTEGWRKLEAPYADGRRHGITRSWYDNGGPRAEVTYERGALAQVRAWRPNGTEVSEQEARALAARDASADDVQFAALESLVSSNMPTCENSAPYGERG
jgi:antitoxin component YwqK of YwqJK toxin-antitoxin module